MHSPSSCPFLLSPFPVPYIAGGRPATPIRRQALFMNLLVNLV